MPAVRFGRCGALHREIGVRGLLHVGGSDRVSSWSWLWMSATCDAAWPQLLLLPASGSSAGVIAQGPAAVRASSKGRCDWSARRSGCLVELQAASCSHHMQSG
eukprot:jgi/Ulvmu1/3638/UM017_0051.1